MALNVPNGDAIAAFEHRLTGYDQPLVCTLGLGLDALHDHTVAGANAVQLAWADNLKTSVTDELTFVSVTIYKKEALGYVPITSNSAAVVGTASGDALPPNVAAMVNKITARPGRAGRGRFFLPGISEAAVSPAGVIAGATLTQFADDLDDMRAAMLGITELDDLLLFHDTTDISPAPTIIDSFAVDARVSSISKRFRRRA